ncbi:hypothetical protein [Limimaricola cinnabarinus]|uniref:hypothetical protein n=1 Tax=Limimaricola cinnabarinus TaxID=1125964 RepID=UPI0013A67E3B|nr:hypothetical protein [Limimaricola cinnabarinus]
MHSASTDVIHPKHGFHSQVMKVVFASTLSVAGYAAHASEVKNPPQRRFEGISSPFKPFDGVSTTLPDKKYAKDDLSGSFVAIDDFASVEPVGGEFSGLWEHVVSADWQPSAVARVFRLGHKRDGWKGPGSIGASGQAVDSVLALIDKLSLAGVDASPRIGLDEDGSFTVSWLDEDLVADVSVFPDGSYSFYAQRGELEAMSDEVSISAPLDPQLAEILVG